MRESKFIEQNHEKWERLEKVLDSPHTQADELSDLFIQVTDDLSYSRTFYKNRSIRPYLNWLAQRLFFKIYRAKRIKKGDFVRFWTDELPQIMYESRRTVLLSFLIFALSAAIGALSQHYDPDFARLILGDHYVEETIRNIEKGDPMNIYKTSGPLGMSLGIMANNLWVALLTFILGLFAAIGSIGLLIRNGVMVGVFQYFFYERGVLHESLLGIWTHGAMEISAIILAGAAGIELGRGLLFPGTYHRLKALQITAQRGLKMYLGIVPPIIIAAFIEGFITRLTDTPDIIRASFILLTFAFMVGYYVLYPILRHRRKGEQSTYMPYLSPDRTEQIQFHTIKTGGELFSDVLDILRKYFWPVMKFTMALAAVYAGAVYTLADDPLVMHSPKVGAAVFQSILEGFSFRSRWSLLMMLLLGGVAWRAYRLIETERGHAHPPLHNIHLLMAAAVPALLYMALFNIQGSFSGLLLVSFPFFLALIFLLNASIFYKPLTKSLGASFRYFFKSISSGVTLMTILTGLGALISLLVTSSVLWFLVYMFGTGFQDGSGFLNKAVPAFELFLSVTVTLWVYLIFVTGGYLLWFSTKEIIEAESAINAVASLGTKKQIRGIPRE